MFSNFKEDARKIIVDAKIEMSKLKHPYVGSEHLLLAILKNDNAVSRRLKDYQLDYDTFKKELVKIVGVGSEENSLFLYTPLLKRILDNAILDSKESHNSEVTIENLFSSLLEEGEGIAIRIMLGMNIDLDELYSEFMYKIANPKKSNEKLLIDELGTDLTKKAKHGELDPVIGREKELKRILEILARRTKNNPILIGEAGVGKTAIVEQLAHMIAFNEVPFALKNKRIISLDMASLVAGTKYRGEFEERVKKLLREIEEHDDIILFIDEIHTLVGAGGAEGAIDASNIFKPALARNKFRCIGATTISEYKKFIEKDAALERRFQKVNIDIPSREDTKQILTNMKSIYEKYHFVNIENSILDAILDLSEKYIYDRNEPDRSLDVLDEVCARVSIKEDKNIKRYNQLKNEYEEIKKQKETAILEGDFNQASNYKDEENNIMHQINELELSLYKKRNKKVTLEDVAEVLSSKTKIPVYEILNDNKKMIYQMKKDLKNSIIGQEEAIDQVVNVAKKIKLGFNNHKCYSMMFVGPSGVGKTMLAKIFGQSLAHNNVIKLDMSEYSEPHSVSKIIGAPPGYVGYENYTNILEEIRNKPYSVLILDEIERAHPNIINLFLNVLEEGKIKDNSGRVIRFDHVTIIMTSNVGFDEIHIGFNEKANDIIESKLKENFSVPFLNRIDNIVIFKPMNKKNIEKLVHLKLERLSSQYKDYHLDISKNVIDEIVEESNYFEYGARKIDKIIQDGLVNHMIDLMIDGCKEIKIDQLNLRNVSYN